MTGATGRAAYLGPWIYGVVYEEGDIVKYKGADSRTHVPTCVPRRLQPRRP